MRERAFTYGTHNGLVGLTCEPDGGPVPGTPGFLFFNIGLNHRVGPQRVQVEVARALAERGYLSLRFDLSGLGDSEPRSDSRSEEARAVLDVSESMDFLQARYGLTQFVLTGLCSGVDPTYAASREDPRVVGAVHIDGYAWPDAGYERRRMLKKMRALAAPERRMQLLSRRLRRLRGLAPERDLETGSVEPIFDRTFPSMESFRAQLQGFLERKMSLLFLYTGQAYFFDQQEQFLSMLGWSEMPEGLEAEYWPESDHIFTTGAMRARLVSRLVRWASARFPTQEAPVPAPPPRAAPVAVAANTGARPYGVWPAVQGSFSTHARSALKHSFDTHPLMQLPALAQLAKDLVPTQQCRFIKPGATQATPFEHSPDSHDGRQVDEAFARIQEPGSWIALYNVETIARYRAFLDEVMTCVRPLVEPEQPGIFNVGGFIFISAPPSVTPFHIDRENNFWLQVKGKKTMTVFDHTDRDLVAGENVDRFILYGALDKVRLREGMAARGIDYEVGPGDGVYFPSTSPHMTRTVPEAGTEVSISIGVVFYTDTTREAAYVHASNLALRKLGLKPQLPGQSVVRDAVKARLGRLVLEAAQRLNGYTPNASFKK